MTIDYDAKLLQPIYAELGVPATLDQGTAGEVTLTVIDKTEGVLLEAGHGLSLASSKPAACVRVAELNEKGLTREGLRGLALSFNDGDWKITATQPKPTVSGPGELYLILQEA